jgi:5'-deoxynucleotidase YfbR-like HD superfamily hydrolase
MDIYVHIKYIHKHKHTHIPTYMHTYIQRTVRTGWKRCGIDDCESVADHSWRMALMTMMLPEGLDK